MTPKEKAKRLVDRFLQRRYTDEDSKECSLICVEQVLEYSSFSILEWGYWQDVIKEINKL